jgi:uncharacterized protein YndB with AHSA1/START domain
MARNTTHVPVAPEDVWDVLADPWAYPRWVVGADRTLRADSSWPAVGSEFEVHLGLGLRDTTTVKELDPGRRIVLHAASSWVGPARVDIALEREGSGTRVTIVEDPVSKLAPLRYFPPVQAAIKLRNVESLRRLRKLAVK